MIYPVLFVLSNVIFLAILIRYTLKGESDQRFVYKVIACLHYLGLAFWAVLSTDLQAHEGWMIVGLVFAFMGDLALGLKHKAKWMMPVGLGFFLLTQWCYTVSFGLSTLSLSLFAGSLILVVYVSNRMKRNPTYDFKGLDLAVLVYAVSMMLMLSGALSLFLLNLQPIPFLKATGALLFVLSDVTLLQLYFHRPKKTRWVLVYLVLYHVAQNILALSLFY